MLLSYEVIHGKSMPTLNEKFEGCIAATWIGSSMGAIVEGWSYEEVEEEYGGRIEDLEEYEHYGNGWVREPGTTEDGIERQKMMFTAIIENEGRIKASDLTEVWVRDADPEDMLMKQEPFDKNLRELAEIGVEPTELGRQWIYPNINSVARASHPLGLINAGDPKSAADDTHEVGKVYAREGTPALRWAALYNAALAEACKPDATVDSILRTARDFATYRSHDGLHGHSKYDSIEREVEQAIEIGRRHDNFEDLRDEFYEYYEGGKYVTYHISRANEVVSKGLGLLALNGPDVEKTILDACNFGRDTDCTAATSCGLAGTLAGSGPIPEEWIEQVNTATKNDPYTNNKRTIEETADQLHAAYMAQRRRLQDYLKMMDEGDYLSSSY